MLRSEKIVLAVTFAGCMLFLTLCMAHAQTIDPPSGPSPAWTISGAPSASQFAGQLREEIAPKLVDIGISAVSLMSAAFLAWLGAFLRGKHIFEKKEEIAFNSITAAVQETWREYVRDIKNGQGGGRLTTEQKSAAQATALSKAKSIAHEQGVDLLEMYSARIVRGLIDRQVEQAKSASDPS